MKLKYYSDQTVERSAIGGKTVPKISFSKNGTISINKAAATKAELTVKDKITFSQDEEAPDNWYFHKDPQHGFELRLTDSKSFIIQHTNLVKELKEKAELDPDKTYSFRVGGPTMMEGDKTKTKYWGILINR